jgi:hypothetical protein
MTVSLSPPNYLYVNKAQRFYLPQQQIIELVRYLFDTLTPSLPKVRVTRSKLKENYTIPKKTLKRKNRFRQRHHTNFSNLHFLSDSRKIPIIIFVCNRTRNEHFACVQQAAKLNFAAVALTTAVKVSHFYIYLLSQLQHIYLHISGVVLQNLDWL